MIYFSKIVSKWKYTHKFIHADPMLSKTSQNIYLDLLELNENLYSASRHISLLYTQNGIRIGQLELGKWYSFLYK